MHRPILVLLAAVLVAAAAQRLHAASAPPQVTFQTTVSNRPVLWRVSVGDNSAPENLSTILDSKGTQPGSHYGPITVSPDGSWYVFRSERFDANSQGYAGLTIASADFSVIETVKADGQTIHGEGGQATAGGNSIVFVAGGGPHTRDLFLVQRQPGGWATPTLLTGGSSFDYNYWPVLSPDSSKVLFDAGADSFPSTRLCEVKLDGTGFRVAVTTNDGPAGVDPSPAVHSGSYAPDGSLVFEAEWGGPERVWRLASGSQHAALVNNTYTNDNSPVVLPDGRIASLLLPQSVHQLKVMNADGTGGVLLTPGTEDIDDIGLGAGPASGTTIPPPHLGRLVIAPGVVKLPTAHRGLAKTKTLLVKNTGKGPLSGEVGALASPFSVTQGGGAFTLPVKGVRSVTVQLLSPTAGSFQTTLTITSDDPARPSVPIGVSGKVK